MIPPLNYPKMTVTLLKLPPRMVNFSSKIGSKTLFLPCKNSEQGIQTNKKKSLLCFRVAIRQGLQ